MGRKTNVQKAADAALAHLKGLAHAPVDPLAAQAAAVEVGMTEVGLDADDADKVNEVAELLEEALAAEAPAGDTGDTGDTAEALAPGEVADDDAPVDLAIPIEEAGRDVAGQPSTELLEEALACWQLTPAHVLAWRTHDSAEGESLGLVTMGGQKLTYPADAERVLTQSDRDGVTQKTDHVHVGGYLRRQV